jgi:NADPH-dependent curcumin reductase
MTSTSRKWIYSTPIVEGVLDREQFSMIEEPLPRLRDGQALARVILINIHCGTRARMVLGTTKPGETDPANYACAEIVDSRGSSFKPGDIIACQAGWQEFQVVSSAHSAIGYAPATEQTKALNRTNSQWNYVFRPSLAAKWSADILMDVFGTSGMTAYFGVHECGPIGPGDEVLVAAASGSTGSLVAQLCQKRGGQRGRTSGWQGSLHLD